MGLKGGQAYRVLHGQRARLDEGYGSEEEETDLPWMVRTMFVRHFIHVFSNDIMSFPNVQNEPSAPFCQKKRETHKRTDNWYPDSAANDQP